MKNRVKRILSEGKVAIGVQLRLGSPAIAELYAHAGFDYVMPDCEHAPQTPVGVQAQFQAMSGTDATPIVRVLKNDADLMRPYLDMGAMGVVAPFVRTPEEAKHGADALRYPPQGTRGSGPSRAAKYGFDQDYFTESDDNMIYLPIIEDEMAVRNIHGILEVDGVDSFIVGPSDLSISLGVPFEFDSPKFKDALQTIIKAGLKSGKPMGMGVYGGDMFDIDTYKRFVDQGFTLLLAAGDEWMLQYGCQKMLDTIASVRG